MENTRNILDPLAADLIFENLSSDVKKPQKNTATSVVLSPRQVTTTDSRYEVTYFHYEFMTRFTMDCEEKSNTHSLLQLQPREQTN